MSVDAIVIREATGERRVPAADLPLKLGTGGDCDIRLPGPASSAVALLDELDGQPFLQPVGNGGLAVNGEALQSSRRLADGDVLEFYGSRIAIQHSDLGLALVVHLEDSAYITRPPDIQILDTGELEETIAPTTFERAAEVAAVHETHSGFRWKAAVAAGIAVLGVLSYLLFTARSIQFEVLPAGADTVQVRGGWFRLPLADRVLLREGSYRVEVSKQGYFDVAQPFDVDASPSRTVRIDMRRLPGFITVNANPGVEAMVTIDDTIIGAAPLGPIELEPGTHTISVTANRFLPFSDKLPVAGLGQSNLIDVQLVPQWADINIVSEPAGAVVYRGETEIGRTPASLEFLEGKHSISVVREGFAPWDGVIDAQANVDQALPVIQLQPANAELVVNTIPRAANVTVDGRYRGQSPLRLALSPGVDYEIGLSKAGYGNTSRSIKLRAAASESITVDLAARTGKVTVAAMPADAEILVDGRVRGTGTMTLDLSSAPHELSVRKDGFESFARSVTPRPGYPQTIRVSLVSEADAKRRSVAATISTSQQQVLRRIEPGAFSLGASRREQGRRANEVIVPVVISKAYFLGEKEVTNAEYLRFRSGHDSGAEVHASLAGNNNPVVNVSWADAVEYCNWLSSEEGLVPAYEKRFEKWEPVKPTPNGYRLPTEAEWAWAIRYQGKAKAWLFPWGGRLPPNRDSGNYADQSAERLVPSLLPGYDDGYASTAPVGSFAANALGLYDGGGNVAEWVQDYYSVPQPGQTEALVDPAGPRRGTQYVIRGSSWRHAGVAELRGSYRDFSKAGRIDVGFRVARNAQ